MYLKNPLLIIILFIYIIFGVIIPYNLMTKNIKKEQTKKSKLLNNIIHLIIYTLLFFILIRIIINPESGLCIDMYGWTDKCKNNTINATICTIITTAFIIIYNYLCKKEIYKIYKYNGNIKYFITILYQLLLIILSIILLLLIKGVIIQNSNNISILNIYSSIIMLLPIIIFPISIYISHFKIENYYNKIKRK